MPVAEQRSGQPLSADKPREVESRALLGPQGQLVIQHDNRRYVLRITKSGKLILTA